MCNSTDPAATTAAELPPCPPWCDPQFCRVTVPGERLHSERPRRFTDEASRVDACLIAPEDRYGDNTYLATYLQLHVSNTEIECDAELWLSLTGAQQLYDQLGARLFTAHQAAAGGVS
ncbi:MAG TPA: hypothetical protein VHH34_24835 [Pseudonocardiaceae bacterium]|nr:hypothetical protein [Pseudonocardiaceae bacterium]